jgi:hypothetical protein
MEVDMSKKKDTHTYKIFVELSYLSIGESMHHRWATPIAELSSENSDEVGVGFLK